MTSSPSGAIEDRISYVLLALALIAASALVFPGLASSPLGIDEHVSYWIAGAENPGTICERSLNYAATPPLSSLVQRTFVALCGKSVLAMRLPSALALLCAVVLTFGFARDVLGPIPAGLAVQFLVWHPDLIDRMRQARPYALTVALAAGLLWLSIRWCRSPKNLGLAASWTIIATALIWTHYLNLPFIALIALWPLGFPRLVVDEQRKPTWTTAVAFATLALLLLPLFPSLMRLQEWTAALNFRAARPPLWQGIGPFWWLTLPAGYIVGGLLTRVIWRKEPVRTHRRPFAVLFLLGCVPVIAFGTIPLDSLATLAEPRYRLVYAPASAALLSACLTCHRHWLAALTASTLGIAGAWMVLGQTPWTSIELTVPAASDWTRLTIELQRLGRPQEPIFVYSGLVESRLVPAINDDPMFHDYVSCRAGRFIIETPHPRLALPWVWLANEPLYQPLFTFYETALRKAELEDISTIWLIASTDTDLARGAVNGFQQFLAKDHYQESARTETPNAILIKFVRATAN